MSSPPKLAAVDPLRDLLGDVLARLEALEAQVGKPRRKDELTPSLHTAPSVRSLTAGEAETVKAYDTFMKNDLSLFCETTDSLVGSGMGSLIQNAFEGIRTVIVLASRAKAPSDPLPEALGPYLSHTQEAVKKIRELRVSRDFDRHQKAVTEMVVCLSWVLCKAPDQLPVPFIKEALGSAEFWSNRIRKDYKGKDETQIAFCDRLKKAMTGLAEYVEQHHKTGLAFNPKGLSFKEAAIRLSDDEPMADDLIKSPKQKPHPTLGTVVSGGNFAGLMGELAQRRSKDGSSAATGLRHVTKDKQTWRKEYKKDDEAKSIEPPPPPLGGASRKDEPKKRKPLQGLPIFEYQDRGFKWLIENHTKESVVKEASKDGILTVEISDPKEQVYMYKCEGISVKVVGKFKSLFLDNCVQCNVVFDTLISSAEIVNCKKIQLQVNGVCPVFTIDKTMNVLVWLSKESLDVSTFTTSLSSEMNVSFPDGDDMKELPIPEQFVHKVGNGSLTSEVSDLYH